MIRTKEEKVLKYSRMYLKELNKQLTEMFEKSEKKRKDKKLFKGKINVLL